MCYAFANPDEGNVYDVFPSQKSRFAFLSHYSVPAKDQWSFENKWKNLARFYQQQEGYLFNKLVKSKSADENDEVRYMSLTQWTTGESFVKSTGKGTHKTLTDELPPTQPLMYKIVVDDTEFDPNESFSPMNSGSLSR